MPRKSDRPYKGKANLDVLFGKEESQTAPQTVPLDSINLPPSLKSRMDKAIAKIKKSKIWDNPKKKRQLEKLLTQLEALGEV